MKQMDFVIVSTEEADCSIPVTSGSEDVILSICCTVAINSSFIGVVYAIPPLVKKGQMGFYSKALGQCYRQVVCWILPHQYQCMMGMTLLLA